MHRGKCNVDTQAVKIPIFALNQESTALILSWKVTIISIIPLLWFLFAFWLSVTKSGKIASDLQAESWTFRLEAVYSSPIKFQILARDNWSLPLQKYVEQTPSKP